MPCALVGALQFWPPAEKSMVWPDTAVPGVCETSVNDATRLTICPGSADFGLWLRLKKVVSEPAPQVTTA